MQHDSILDDYTSSKTNDLPFYKLRILLESILLLWGLAAILGIYTDINLLNFLVFEIIEHIGEWFLFGFFFIGYLLLVLSVPITRPTNAAIRLFFNGLTVIVASLWMFWGYFYGWTFSIPTIYMTDENLVSFFVIFFSSCYFFLLANNTLIRQHKIQQNINRLFYAALVILMGFWYLEPNLL